jgi:hypothetical protein
LYELIANRELESFKDGGSRKITMRSIRAHVARKLDQANADLPNQEVVSGDRDRLPSVEPTSLRRGRARSSERAAAPAEPPAAPL